MQLIFKNARHFLFFFEIPMALVIKMGIDHRFILYNSQKGFFFFYTSQNCAQ